MKLNTKLWIGIAVLVVLSPLGLILPEYFKSSGAWGESKLSSLWNAPLPDYAFKGWEQKGLPRLSFAYIISAVIGILITVIAVFLIGKFLSKKDE